MSFDFGKGILLEKEHETLEQARLHLSNLSNHIEEGETIGITYKRVGEFLVFIHKDLV